MQANVGGFDKTARIVVGLVVVLWGVLAMNYFGAIGLVLIGTAVINWCPAYVPFGINSAKNAD